MRGAHSQCVRNYRKDIRNRIEFLRAFAQAICQQIADPSLQRLAKKALIGSIDQFSDSTDLRSEPGWRAALKELYVE